MNRNVEKAREIAEKVALFNGRTFYVGGYVRDEILNTANDDIDIEIHGIDRLCAEKILDSVGERTEFGECFGIYGLKGYSLDIALPRVERCIGKGHRDFDICVDTFAGFEAAARRRDFTVNSLMKDVLSGEIIDCFGGIADIDRKIIRHVDADSFSEDPLRVLRAGQFSARLGFDVAPDTEKLCEKISLDELPKERIMGETAKALIKSDRPSRFFEFLRRVGHVSDIFPELFDLIGVAQNPVFHPEGDVWNHTMIVVDRAAKMKMRAKNSLAFMLAALCHDFGKAVCTDELMHSYCHETEGLPLIESFLKRLTDEKAVISYVLELCENHMKPNVFAFENVSVKTTNRLFDSVSDPEGLICLSTADNTSEMSNEAFLLERLDTYRDTMSRPYVMGRDLINSGINADESFSDYLEYAHKLRLAGIDKENALKQTLGYIRSKKRE